MQSNRVVDGTDGREMRGAEVPAAEHHIPVSQQRGLLLFKMSQVLVHLAL